VLAMNIEKTVLNIISDQLKINAKDIKWEQHLIHDLKADSLDIVEIIMSLEEALDIQIPDAEAEKLSDIKSLIEYLKK